MIKPALISVELEVWDGWKAVRTVHEDFVRAISHIEQVQRQMKTAPAVEGQYEIEMYYQFEDGFSASTIYVFKQDIDVEITPERWLKDEIRLTKEYAAKDRAENEHKIRCPEDDLFFNSWARQQEELHERLKEIQLP